jgi:hypothetical protein
MDLNQPKSKGPFDSNSRAKQLEPTFFIDRSLGKTIFPDALRQARISLRIHDDYFDQDARDHDILKVVGQHGWIFVTVDKRIRYSRAARVEIERSKVAVFIISTKGSIKGHDKAKIFIDALPSIKRFLKRHRPPFIAKIWRGGKVEKVR